MTLTKDAIFAADDLPRQSVHVSEWGGDVHVRTMTSSERDAWESGWLKWREKENGDRDDMRYFRAYLAAKCVCDEDGKLLFGDADVRKLGDKSGKALSLLADVAMRLNGMGGEAAEDAAKN